MQTPKKQVVEPTLTVLPNQAEVSQCDEGKATSFDGGGGPPTQPLMKDTGGLWVICIFGMLLVAISMFALSNDPAAATYRQPHLPTFGDFRIFCELSVLVVGSACMFPLLVCIRAVTEAKKIEIESAGRVKSLRGKKLEKISNDGILGIIGNYISALLGAL